MILQFLGFIAISIVLLFIILALQEANEKEIKKRQKVIDKVIDECSDLSEREKLIMKITIKLKNK